MKQELFNYFAMEHGLTLTESEAVDVQSAVERSAWTDVKEELPDSDTIVMVFSAAWDDPVEMGFLDGEDWRNFEGMKFGEDSPTHWRDIPEGPAVKEGGVR